MKKLILVIFTLGLFAVSGCAGTGDVAGSGVNLGEAGEFAPVSE